MRGKPVSYFDFSGGVNLEAAPYLLEENQARDSLNVQTTATGQLRKRTGFSPLTSLSASPASFTSPPHSLFASNLSTKHLLAVGGIAGAHDRIVSITMAGSVTDRSPAVYAPGARWYIAQGKPTSGTKGPIFAMNGVDAPQHWTGTGNFAPWTADVGTIPATGRYLVYHGSRLWCAEMATQGRIRYSGITGTSPDTGNWDANGFVDLDTSDGQDITAVAPFGPYLIVFKPRKSYVIYDLVTGANRVLSTSVGCVSHRSCVATPMGLFFLDDEQGIMLTDGDKITNVSEPIKPLLDDAARFPTTIKNAAGTYHDNRFFLSLASVGGVNDLTVEYDLLREAWWIHDCASNQFALTDPQGTPVLYSANPGAIRVEAAFEDGTYADNDLPYAGGAFWTGPELIWGAPHIVKRVREVRVDGRGEWGLRYYRNYELDFTEDAGEVWESNAVDPLLFADIGHVFAPSSPNGEIFAPRHFNVTDRRYHTLGVARAWSFSLFNNDDEDFQIYSMTVATTGRTD